MLKNCPIENADRQRSVGYPATTWILDGYGIPGYGRGLAVDANRLQPRQLEVNGGSLYPTDIQRISYG